MWWDGGDAWCGGLDVMLVDVGGSLVLSAEEQASRKQTDGQKAITHYDPSSQSNQRLPLEYKENITSPSHVRRTRYTHHHTLRILTQHPTPS